jgi:hypothetical protein
VRVSSGVLLRLEEGVEIPETAERKAKDQRKHEPMLAHTWRSKVPAPNERPRSSPYFLHGHGLGLIQLSDFNGDIRSCRDEKRASIFKKM